MNMKVPFQSMLLIAATACALAAAPAAKVPAAPRDPRAEFLKLIDRPVVPLAPQIQPVARADGITEFKFSYTTEKDQVVPGILLKQANATPGKHPVVVALHGTNGKKEDERAILQMLVTRGFIGIAIDGRYHG